jgi:hypothetical protein
LLAFFAEPPQSLLELGAPAVFSLLFLRQFHGYPGLSLGDRRQLPSGGSY